MRVVKRDKFSAKRHKGKESYGETGNERASSNQRAQRNNRGLNSRGRNAHDVKLVRGNRATFSFGWIAFVSYFHVGLAEDKQTNCSLQDKYSACGENGTRRCVFVSFASFFRERERGR